MRRIVIHNHLAKTKDAGRAVSREEEERNRADAYQRTGISRDKRATDATVEGKVVKVGDVVGFKSDHEQYGKITAINGTKLTLYNPNGFGGDYLRYAKTTIEDASDCWLN